MFVLDLDRDTTMIFHDESLETEKYGPTNLVRRRLWNLKKKIPQMSMGVSLLTYHENHAHSMQL